MHIIFIITIITHELLVCTPNFHNNFPFNFTSFSIFSLLLPAHLPILHVFFLCSYLPSALTFLFVHMTN